MLAIETCSLVKKFGSFTAVDQLNLNVPEGSIYGFLGPNGAGKTTTIKMLTGLSKATGGTIRICENEVKFGSIRHRTDVGYLPDVPSFYHWMTPREYLEFCGDLFSMEPRLLKKRVGELLNLVGLEDKKKKIGGFSRGMKQRLGIAQALINQPKVVFLDEPTSALDPIGRKEVMDIIQKLSGTVTVFFSTHILADVERVCDRVVILNKGKAVVEDSMEHLRSSYASKSILLELAAPEEGQKIIQRSAQLPWVESVQAKEANVLQLTVRDMKEAQYRLPGIIGEAGCGLKELRVIEPTLEDIFMKAVKEE